MGTKNVKALSTQEVAQFIRDKIDVDMVTADRETPGHIEQVNEPAAVQAIPVGNISSKHCIFKFWVGVHSYRIDVRRVM